jgi:hypothetical protein
MSSTNTIINPKLCNYNCGTRIYWNNEENALKFLVIQYINILIANKVRNQIL